MIISEGLPKVSKVIAIVSLNFMGHGSVNQHLQTYQVTGKFITMSIERYYMSYEWQ